MKINASLLQRLPKVELHCHLDGSLRIPTIIDLANQDKINIPTSNPDQLSKLLTIGKKRGSLEEYIKRFDITLSVMQTPQALERTSYELIEDVSKENVRYIEVRYSPILHTEKGMTISDSVDAVRAGLKRGEKDFGVKSGIIVCGIRNISSEASLKLADLTVRYKNKGVVGFDLAGAEENYPAKDHREAFYMILNNNINATIHAGEAADLSYIEDAVLNCKAQRIGHGWQIIDGCKKDGDIFVPDSEIAEVVLERQIPLEICISSNVKSGASEVSIDNHPALGLLKSGFRV